MCAHEKKCAVARSGKCVLRTLPIAFSELRLPRRENATHLPKKFWMAVRGRGSYRDCFLEVSYSGFPELVRTSGTASSVASGLTTYHPASCVVAVLSKSKTTRVGSTRMLKTTEKRKVRLGVRVLFCEVLLSFFAQPFQVLANFRIKFGIQSLSVFRWNMYNIHVSSRLSFDLGYRQYRFMVLHIFLFHVDTPDCCSCLVVQAGAS